MSISKKKIAYNELLKENLQSISQDNFSINNVPAGKVVDVFQNQQMIVDGHMTVGGHLRVLGDLVDISGRQSEKFFYDTVKVDEVVEVQSDRLLLYKDHITISGHIRVNGRLSGV